VPKTLRRALLDAAGEPNRPRLDLLQADIAEDAQIALVRAADRWGERPVQARVQRDEGAEPGCHDDHRGNAHLQGAQGHSPPVREHDLALHLLDGRGPEGVRRRSDAQPKLSTGCAAAHVDAKTRLFELTQTLVQLHRGELASPPASMVGNLQFPHVLSDAEIRGLVR